MLNEPTLELIRREIADALSGRRVGRIFQLSKLGFAIDFRDGDRFLFISADPAAPRVYLIRRRLRDLEKESIPQLSFAQFLRKRISGARLASVEKAHGERVLILRFDGTTETGDPTAHSLVLQLTGRSANFFLLDREGRILDRLRDTYGDGQEIASLYGPPARPSATRNDETVFGRSGFDSLSDALDSHYLELAAKKEFARICAAARSKLSAGRAKHEKLIAALRSDLGSHGDPDRWKRSGDLLLANLADAAIVDGKALVVDYFDDSTPVVEIEIDENDSLTEAAEKFFKRYTKARNAREELAGRIEAAEEARSEIEVREQELERAIADGDVESIRSIAGIGVSRTDRKAKTDQPSAPRGTRRFLSSDGFEILVGKGAKDNDELTFKIGRSGDLWLHAADYPGSHVIVRNPNRVELPPRTLLEAAQYAANYSDARSQPKIAVHYTLRKNVHKPRGGAPGLVRLTSFKTILVESEK